MKRSQTAKTSNKNPCVEFIDDSDRKIFCKEIVSMLQSSSLKQKIFEKQKKYKTFTITETIESLAKIGLDPKIKFHFKKILKTNEFDLNIEVKRKNGAALEEYFDKV